MLDLYLRNLPLPPPYPWTREPDANQSNSSDSEVSDEDVGMDIGNVVQLTE